VQTLHASMRDSGAMRLDVRSCRMGGVGQA